MESGKKIGSILGSVKDILVVDTGGQEERHINICCYYYGKIGHIMIKIAKKGKRM